MSRIAEKISGCYRRVLIFIFLVLIVSVAVGAFLYNRVGGKEGLHYWMAERALNTTEKVLQANRPDGIPKDNVESQFKRVRDAIKARQINLPLLYESLNSYQDKFQSTGLSDEKIKPSTPEVEEFLIKLEQTITEGTDNSDKP